MAATDILVDKACLVRIDVGAGMVALGYNRNQATVEMVPYWADVHNDRGGGDEGMPIDSQAMGVTYRGHLELTTFDDTNAQKVLAIIRGGTAGTFAFANVGKLAIADTADIKINLNSTNRPMTFHHCKIEAGDWGKGTKFTTFSIDWEAIVGTDGVLYTMATS
jgi:hypothetical protein